MFTGLVEGLGIVTAIRDDDDTRCIEIDVSAAWTATGKIGDSVAINGCCLTVVAIDGPRWTFQAGEETLSKTNLRKLKRGAPVNLERALPADGRLGGHFVQGHIDGTGQLSSITYDGDWAFMSFRVPKRLAAMMVPKGSVAVDGVSLTLVDVERDSFSVALIPHTLEATTLGTRKIGDAVNIETDILGKYVQKFLKLTAES